MYPNRPYDPGPPMVDSSIVEQKADTEDILLPTHPVSTKGTKTSSTLVFHLENNKEISIDRSSSFRTSTQNIPSSPTLEVESISEERDLRGFWTESLTDISKKLWVPEETDLQGLDSSCLSGFSKNTIHNSYLIKPTKKHLQMNSPTTSWPLSPSLVPSITENKSIKYCRKIRIYPTTTQKELYEECFRATRFIHNKALEYIQNHPKTSLNPISLRQNTMLSDKQLNLDENRQYQWLTRVPYATRQLVLRQLSSNFKTNFTLLKKKQIKFFEMKFKSKKNPYQVCFIDKNALKLDSLRLFKRRSKEEFKVRKRLNTWISKQTSTESNCILRREKNRYYLCIPKTRTTKHIETPYRKVALDPGVRTFQTFYSSEGIAGKIGDSLCETLIDIGVQEDKLKSILQTKRLKKRTRYNIRRRCFLLRSKIKNVVNDLHWKTCSFLCSNFKHILLPSYETSNMVRKDIPERARKIRSKTVRQMLALSPYAFKEKLLFKAKCTGTHVDIVNEAYTTKTCGGCGHLKEMGGLKTYSCRNCGFNLDRDYNGARNIFLRYY